MNIQYVAEDGVVFDDREACEKYENSIKKEERFTVINYKNFFDRFVVKEDKQGNLYIEQWDCGDCVFDGTLRKFLGDKFK